VKSVALRSSAVCCLTFILLSGTSLGSAAHAQSATWLANPGSSNLGAASNWSPAVVPAGTSFQATFGASSTTTLTGTLAVGTWQFLAGAPAYTFNPSGALSFSNGGIVNNSAYAPTFNLTAGPLLMVGSSSAGNAIFNIGSGLAAQILANATLANSTFGVSGTLRLSNSATAANATIAINSGGNLTFLNTSTGGNARLIANAGSTVNMSGITSAGLTAGSIEGAGTYALGTKLLTVGSNGLSTGVSGAITGTTGGLTKIGGGTLTLSGANTYTGATSLNAGGLVVNGSLASAVTVNDGFLGGTGSVGGLTVNGGALAPGNSIGTLNVAGNYIHNAGGTYQVEINAAGQSDRTNVTGTATLNGGAVQVIAAPGSYAASTTYTIVNAIGGVSGAYTGATTNLAFLAPTLSYDLNNVYLNVRTSFAGGGETPNEVAVGTALDGAAPSASGDLGTVIGALLGLDTVLGPAALTALSGQPYASFGTINVQADHLFMNAVGQQTKLARRGAAGARVALAEACEVACDTAAPGGWGTWMSGLGGVGSVGGDANSAALTYSMGGVAVGADRRIDEHLLVGPGGGLLERAPVGRRLPGRRLGRYLQRGTLCQLQSRRLLHRRAGRLCLFGQPAPAADRDRRAGTAHSAGPRRRQPVPRASRGGLQDGGLRSGRGDADAVRAAADGGDLAGRLWRERGGRDQPQRRAAEHHIGTDGDRRRPRRQAPAGQPARARPGAAAGLGARVRRHGTADDGGLRRRAGRALHRLRRATAA
jgi:autotransporter-associated beta strand protein